MTGSKTKLHENVIYGNTALVYQLSNLEFGRKEKIKNSSLITECRVRICNLNILRVSKTSNEKKKN